MDCVPDNFCHHLIPSSLLWYVWFQEFFFLLFFSFSKWGKWSSKSLHKFKFKSSISSWDPFLLCELETCQYALPAQFTTHWSQHACTDTPYNAASKPQEERKRGKSCTPLSEKVLFLYLHTLCSPPVCKDRDDLMVVTHLIMLQTTLIKNKICSEEN